MVLIHGFGANHLSWSGNTSAVMQVAKTYVVDLPAHGDADTSITTVGLAEMANCVLDTLTAQQIHSAHLIAHSLGAAVAMEICRQNSQFVMSLTLIAPAGLGTGIDPYFLKQFPLLHNVGDINKLLQTLVVNPQLISRQIAAQVLRQLRQPNVRLMLTQIAEELMQAEYILQPALASIVKHDIPRHTIWGKSDQINPTDSDRLSAFGGTHSLLADCGHLPHIEKSRAVNELFTNRLTLARSRGR